MCVLTALHTASYKPHRLRGSFKKYRSKTECAMCMCLYVMPPPLYLNRSYITEHSRSVRVLTLANNLRVLASMASFLCFSFLYFVQCVCVCVLWCVEWRWVVPSR